MKVSIIGAGLAGATAAALLKDRHECTVYEEAAHIGGLCADYGGVQWCGPHALHTDDDEVWRFVQEYADWRTFTLRVAVMTDPGARELPSIDPAFEVYTEKAWGMPFGQVPEWVRNRVPRTAGPYHTGKHRAHPVGGYSAMIERMLAGVEVAQCRVHPNELPDGPCIYTGNINHYCGPYMPWIGREWHYQPGAQLETGSAHIFNYAMRTVPQLRSYDCQRINPWHTCVGVVSEFYAAHGRPCYPAPAYAEQARGIVQAAKARGHWLCGRMGSYQYLDMDATIRNVMDTIQEAGL